MFRIDSAEQLTPEVIRRVIYRFRGEELPRLQKLKNYYLNKTAILCRQKKDSTRPDNRVVHPFAQYITDTLVGYFVGEPVIYSSNEDIEALKLVFDYNDEQDENMTLAKDCSIYGKAYEYCYVDSDGSVRFMSLDPREIIPIYSTSLADELKAVIRFYKQREITSDNEVLVIEVYDDKKITRYKTNVEIGTLTTIDEREHAFGDVPFIEYRNNDDCYGDFEGVISLIDAYDALVSDDMNDFQEFVDAYLALYGYNADRDDIQQMKENKVLLMDLDSKAEWVVKQSDGSAVETKKSRLERDIHKFSKTPNSSDTNFSSNVSGVAMKYKLLGTENLGSIKERKFKKGLVRRLELLSHIMQLLGRASFDWLGVDITFTRNLPINEDDVSTMVKNLNGIVSKKTLVGQLPFVEDAEAEIEQLQKEQASSIFYATPNAITDDQE